MRRRVFGWIFVLALFLGGSSGCSHTSIEEQIIDMEDICESSENKGSVDDDAQIVTEQDPHIIDSVKDEPLDESSDKDQGHTWRPAKSGIILSDNYEIPGIIEKMVVGEYGQDRDLVYLGYYYGNYCFVTLDEMEANTLELEIFYAARDMSNVRAIRKYTLEGSLRDISPIEVSVGDYFGYEPILKVYTKDDYYSFFFRKGQKSQPKEWLLPSQGQAKNLHYDEADRYVLYTDDEGVKIYDLWLEKSKLIYKNEAGDSTFDPGLRGEAVGFQSTGGYGIFKVSEDNEIRGYGLYNLANGQVSLFDGVEYVDNEWYGAFIYNSEDGQQWMARVYDYIDGKELVTDVPVGLASASLGKNCIALVDTCLIYCRYDEQVNLVSHDLVSGETEVLGRFSKEFSLDKEALVAATGDGLLIQVPGQDNNQTWAWFPRIKDDQSIKTIDVAVEINVQADEYNRILDGTAHLPEPNWSDDIRIRFLKTRDHTLTQAVKAAFPGKEVFMDSGDLVVQWKVEGADRVKVDRTILEPNGYMLNQDIDISFSGENMDFDLVRWNEDRTEKMWFTQELLDDAIYFTMTFEEIVNQALIEEAIESNLVYLSPEAPLPRVDFKWIDERTVNIDIQELKEDAKYLLSLNGYVNEDGMMYFTSDETKSYMESFENYIRGGYEFVKLEADTKSYVTYSLGKGLLESYWSLPTYSLPIGTSDGESGLVQLGGRGEWQYQNIVYDRDLNQFVKADYGISTYSDSVFFNGRLHQGIYNRIQVYDEMAGEFEEVFILEGEEEFIYGLTPASDGQEILLLSMSDNIEEPSFFMTVLDTSYHLLSESVIDFIPAGTYEVNTELYWISDHEIAITGSQGSNDSSSHLLTYVFDVYSGEVSQLYAREKVMTISDDYRYRLMQDEDEDAGIIRVYDQDNQLLFERNMDEFIDYDYRKQYDYYDFWLGSILYLQYGRDNRIIKWNMEDNSIAVFQLPYGSFVIEKVVEEDQFRLWLNSDYMHRSAIYYH